MTFEDCESLEGLAEYEADYGTEDVLIAAGYDPRYTEVDTMMGAPIGTQLMFAYVAEHGDEPMER
jgi:hypothetical protein